MGTTRAKLCLALALLVLVAADRFWIELRLAHWNDPPPSLSVLREAARERGVRGEHEPRVRRVVLFVADGVRARDAPKLPGAFATLDSGVPSFSKASFHRMLTGAPSWATGVRSNRFEGRARLPTVIDSLRSAGLRPTFVADTVPWIADMAGRRGDATSLGDGFGEAYGRALESNAPLVVAHTCAADEAAHVWGRDSEAYRRALEKVHGWSRQAFEATSPGLDLVAVVGDHGHVERGGHGGPEPDARSAFLLLRGRGIPDGVFTQGTLEQVAVTLAAAAGVPPPGGAVAPPLKPLVPHVKEDAARRRRVLAAAKAAVPEDRPFVRTVALAAALAVALLVLARRRGARGAVVEVGRASIPLAAFAVMHLAFRGGPSLSAVWLGNPYTFGMGGLALLAYGLHAIVLARTNERRLFAVGVGALPLAASFARLGATMGPDAADPAWHYVGIAGLFPLAGAAVVAAAGAVVSVFAEPTRRQA